MSRKTCMGCGEPTHPRLKCFHCNSLFCQFCYGDWHVKARCTRDLEVDAPDAHDIDDPDLIGIMEEEHPIPPVAVDNTVLGAQVNPIDDAWVEAALNRRPRRIR